MNFTDSAKVPIVINVGEQKTEVPKFIRADWKAWAAELDKKRLDAATDGMTPEQRFKFVAFFSVPPTSADELRRLAFTVDGQDRIIGVCLNKLGWPEEKIADFIDANDPDDIQLLTIQLASIKPRLPDASAATAASTAEGEQRPDPPEKSQTDLGSD